MKFRREILQNNLRKFREAKGHRQIDVVDKLGFTTTDRLSYWERGIAAPNIVNLFRLAALYEVKPHELYFRLTEHTSFKLAEIFRPEPEII